MSSQHRTAGPMIGTIILLALLSGCSDGFGFFIGCEDWTRASVTVEVRDEKGNPAAIGSTLILRKGSEEVVTKGYGLPSTISANVNWTGTMWLEVTKPWHESRDPRRIEVSADECGRPRTKEAGAKVSLMKNAPPVRQVVTPPIDYAIGDGNISEQLAADVLGDPGIDTAVHWVSRDTLVVKVTPSGLVTSVCRIEPGDAYVVAQAVADTTVSDSTHFWVRKYDPNSGRCPVS